MDEDLQGTDKSGPNLIKHRGLGIMDLFPLSGYTNKINQSKYNMTCQKMATGDENQS